MFLLEQLLPFLVVLAIFGLPVGVALWIHRRVEKREALARANAADLPTREEFAELVEEVESLGRQLADLDERQVFLERLLEKPRESSGIEAASSSGRDEIA
jgi:hypothetical protein